MDVMCRGVGESEHGLDVVGDDMRECGRVGATQHAHRHWHRDQPRFSSQHATCIDMCIRDLCMHYRSVSISSCRDFVSIDVDAVDVDVVSTSTSCADVSISSSSVAINASSAASHDMAEMGRWDKGTTHTDTSCLKKLPPTPHA